MGSDKGDGDAGVMEEGEEPGYDTRSEAGSSAGSQSPSHSLSGSSISSRSMGSRSPSPVSGQSLLCFLLLLSLSSPTLSFKTGLMGKLFHQGITVLVYFVIRAASSDSLSLMSVLNSLRGRRAASSGRNKETTRLWPRHLPHQVGQKDWCWC